MKTNKGFTLIELLAVIVILAIIALIAVPVVIKAIDKAQQGSARSTADSYLKGVETTVQLEQITSPEKTPSTTLDSKVYFGSSDEDGVDIDLKNATSITTAVLTYQTDGSWTGYVETSNKYCVPIFKGEVRTAAKKVTACETPTS